MLMKFIRVVPQSSRIHGLIRGRDTRSVCTEGRLSKKVHWQARSREASPEMDYEFRLPVSNCERISCLSHLVWHLRRLT